jgi:hypothetical protein
MVKRDAGLDALLDLDGETMILDANGHYWVKFEVKRVLPSEAKPHGLDYSLTMHGPDSGNPNDSRLIGFDNAHLPEMHGPARKSRKAWDHRHRFRAIRPYDYTDAAALLTDFWEQVYSVLDERGIHHD